MPLDPDKPSTTAVAVVGDRIPATGRPEELTVAAGGQPDTVDTIFADKVIVRANGEAAIDLLISAIRWVEMPRPNPA